MKSIDSTLKRIFHEAQVIDLDFSKWDKYVRLVVVASAFPLGSNQRFPLFNIDFERVSLLNWATLHLGIRLHPPSRHMQWTIVQYTQTIVDGQREVQLSGLVPPSPLLVIRCQSIAVSSLSNDVVDTVNPSWNRPYGPLARPCFVELVRS